MKTIVFAFALLFGTTLFAQEKKSATKKTATPQSSVGACYADKKWMLKKVEKFGQEKDPLATQKNDFLLLKGDNTFTIMLNGIDKFGTYTKSGALINLKLGDGSETMPFKIISCDGNALKVDFRDGDTHNIFTYGTQ